MSSTPLPVSAPTAPARRLSVQPAGYLMGRPGVLVLLAFLVLAAWNGRYEIAVLLSVALAAAGLARLWSRMSLVGVTCQRTVSDHRLFPGEHLEVKFSLVNRKVLPVPCIQVESEIPAGLAGGSSLVPGARPGFSLLTRSTALLWYAAASWRCRLRAAKRGYYPLGDITVTSGDIFALYPRSTTLGAPDSIIVYPRLYDVGELAIPSLYPLGDTVTDRRVFEDPTRAIGVRDYTPGDSLRHIHWKASARHQNLKVKVFEPSTTLKLALFLAVDSFRAGPDAEENFELGISTAASAARDAIERGSAAGLFVNSRQADSGEPVRILPGGDTGHLIAMLEALAKVTGSVTDPLPEFIQKERGDLPMGTTLVLVLMNVPPSLPALLASLKHAGYSVLVLQVGGDAGDGAPGVPWHRVRQRPGPPVAAGVESP